MTGNPRFTASALPRLAAPILICAAAALGPNGALAQAAGNLNCNKCVDSGDVAKKAVTKKKIDKGAVTTNRIKEGAVDRTKLSTDLQDHFDQRGTFFVTLDGDGAQATIATLGPLTYFVRCLVSRPVGGGGFRDGIEIVATSSVDGWFEEDESDNFGGNSPLLAGEEVIVQDHFAPSGAGARFRNIEESSAVAPDGSHLALKGDTGAFGTNLLGHDCVAMGTIFRITGTL